MKNTKPKVTRLRVTRTIVVEGDDEWVNRTLEVSLVSPTKPFSGGTGRTVTEPKRVIEVIGDRSYRRR